MQNIHEALEICPRNVKRDVLRDEIVTNLEGTLAAISLGYKTNNHSALANRVNLTEFRVRGIAPVTTLFVRQT